MYFDQRTAGGSFFIYTKDYSLNKWAILMTKEVISLGIWKWDWNCHLSCDTLKQDKFTPSTFTYVKLQDQIKIHPTRSSDASQKPCKNLAEKHWLTLKKSSYCFVPLSINPIQPNHAKMPIKNNQFLNQSIDWLATLLFQIQRKIILYRKLLVYTAFNWLIDWLNHL